MEGKAREWWTIPKGSGLTIHCKCGKALGEGGRCWMGEGTGYIYCPDCIPSRQAEQAEAVAVRQRPKRAHRRVDEWALYDG